MRILRDGAGAPRPAALIVAHPSHEARLNGWLQTVSPSVFILTDGSGLSGTSRIERAASYVEEVGAKSGSVFGRFTDLALYKAILNQDIELFCDLTDELVDEISENEFDCVVGDAMEGYNPTHDVCRIVVDSAVDAVRKKGCEVKSYEYPMFELSNSCSDDGQDGGILLRLDDEGLQRKIDVARKHYPELVEQLETAIRFDGSGPLRDFLDAGGKLASSVTTGLGMLRTESLRPVLDSATPEWSGRPFYEARSEAHVSAGHFDRVIRFREHLQPLAAALHEHVATAY